MHFFFDNAEMLTALENGMSSLDLEDETLLQQDLANLLEIKNGTGRYRNTRYHCSGVPFTKS